MKNAVKNFINTITFPIKALRKKAPLTTFIAGRFITMTALLFLLGFALFALMALAPGDIADQMMSQQIMSGAEGKTLSFMQGNDDSFSEEQLSLLRKEFGLDQPFYVQYGKWLNRVLVHHDLGISLVSRTPVSFLIPTRQSLI